MVFSLNYSQHTNQPGNQAKKPRSHPFLQEHLTGSPSPINSVQEYLNSDSLPSPFLELVILSF